MVLLHDEFADLLYIKIYTFPNLGPKNLKLFNSSWMLNQKKLFP